MNTSVGIPDPALIKPEGYTLDAALLARPGNVDTQLDLFLDYRQQREDVSKVFRSTFERRSLRCLRSGASSILTSFRAGAEAFKRDIPNATVQFLPTGHFALETHLEEIAFAMRQFLSGQLQGPR